MSRLPSTETQLKTANKRIRELTEELMTVRIERDQYRARATRAEVDRGDWIARFDKLLERTPKEPT